MPWARGTELLSDRGLSQLFNIKYLSSGFERGYKQEERENAQFCFFDFGKCWKAVVLQIIIGLFKVVLRITHSGRSSFMFLLPVVLKQLQATFWQRTTTCAALLLTSVDFQCVIPSDGKTWGINHNGSSMICLTAPSQLGFAGCWACTKCASCSGVPWRSSIHKIELGWSYLGLQSCSQKTG